jgi:CRP/FNR family cyclic AMP-dependent transcriptional regulator
MSIDESLVTGAAPLQGVRHAAGSVIFNQGDPGDAAYFIRKGRVRIFQTNEGQRVEVGEMGPGEIFGEMAVLDGGKRSASAVAAEDCVVSCVAVQVFRRKLDATDPFIKAMIELFIRNIRNSPKLFLRRPRSFRDHVKQMKMFSWNMRRFTGRMNDEVMADNVLDILERLDAVMTDLQNVADLIPDKRHDLIAEEELNGVNFSDVISTEGQRVL